MNRTSGLVVIAFILAMTQSSCTSTFPVNCNEPSIELSNHGQTQLNSIEIKIDATPSMQGYVAIPNSDYIKALGYLDAAASNLTTSGGKVEYYRFGIKPLLWTNSYIQAQQATFYSSSDPNFRETRIDEAINLKPAENKLLVIVTDLYQQQTDIGRVTNRLKPYLEKNYAVAVLALNSRYKGQIYDFDPSGAGFSYQGNRPFYLIMVGTYNSIIKYFDELKSLESNLFKKENFLLFSPQIVSEPLFLSLSNQSQSSQGVKRRQSLWVDGNSWKKIQIKTEEQPQRTDLIEVKGGQAPDLIELPEQKVSYAPLSYSLQSSNRPENLFKLEPKIGVFNRINEKFDFDNSGIPTDIIKIKALKLESNNLNFITAIDNDKLDLEKTYSIQIDVRPNPDFINFLPEQADWWSRWNSDGGIADGSKTLNLKNFLNRLQGAMLQAMNSQNQVVGRFCYVIQKTP